MLAISPDCEFRHLGIPTKDSYKFAKKSECIGNLLIYCKVSSDVFLLPISIHNQDTGYQDPCRQACGCLMGERLSSSDDFVPF